MRVELSPKVTKYLNSMDRSIKNRIVAALTKLSEEPPQGNIRAMAGRDGYRLRVGDYRLLFDVTDTAIIVYDIGTRGQIYRGGR